MRVEVVQARALEFEAVTVELPPGATVRKAVTASGLLDGDSAHRKYGIFGKVVEPETLIAEGDRIEIYRPLSVDPKEARRRRAKKRRR